MMPVKRALEITPDLERLSLLQPKINDKMADRVVTVDIYCCDFELIEYLPPSPNSVCIVKMPLPVLT